MGEKLCVEGARFECAFSFVLRANRINFSRVRGTQENFTGGIAGDARDLRGAGLGEMREDAVAIDGEESAAVACPRQEAAIGCEPEGVNDVFARGPKFFRCAVGADAVNAAGEKRRKWNKGLLWLDLPGIHDGASGERSRALWRGDDSGGSLAGPL